MAKASQAHIAIGIDRREDHIRTGCGLDVSISGGVPALSTAGTAGLAGTLIVTAVAPGRLPEMFAKVQKAFDRAAEEGSVTPVHMFYRE